MKKEDGLELMEQNARVPRLGEIGLENFPPYLMNRIMGRYNAALRDESGKARAHDAQDARACGPFRA